MSKFSSQRVHISCGHQLGIGIEILIKALIALPQQNLNCFLLHAPIETLHPTLKSLSISYSINNSTNFYQLKFSNKILNIKNIEYSDTTASTASLLSCIQAMQKNDVLVTLPTSKDQLRIAGKNLAGHTEFFRKYFDNNNIAMSFIAINAKILLITDHVPLRAVADLIKKDLIINKISTTIKGHLNFKYPLKKILISGLNPHAGEEGILGDEETEIIAAINILKQQFSDISFIGPLPADTLHRHENESSLTVYMYHDQGLTRFKALNPDCGINISFGLPFIRLSVDHGTAFDLYLKNKANFKAQLNVLQFAIHNCQ